MVSYSLPPPLLLLLLLLLLSALPVAPARSGQVGSLLLRALV